MSLKLFLTFELFQLTDLDGVFNDGVPSLIFAPEIKTVVTGCRVITDSPYLGFPGALVCPVTTGSLLILILEKLEILNFTIHFIDTAIFEMSYSSHYGHGTNTGHQNFNNAQGIALELEQKHSGLGSHTLKSQNPSTKGFDAQNLHNLNIKRNTLNSRMK